MIFRVSDLDAGAAFFVDLHSFNGGAAVIVCDGNYASFVDPGTTFSCPDPSSTGLGLLSHAWDFSDNGVRGHALRVLGLLGLVVANHAQYFSIRRTHGCSPGVGLGDGLLTAGSTNYTITGLQGNIILAFRYTFNTFTS